jgi:hypothetical protein
MVEDDDFGLQYLESETGAAEGAYGNAGRAMAQNAPWLSLSNGGTTSILLHDANTEGVGSGFGFARGCFTARLSHSRGSRSFDRQRRGAFGSINISN